MSNAGVAGRCRLGNQPFFTQAPEICVEVISSSNTEAELKEKMALYFGAGAQEVWLCAASGARRFMARHSARALRRSALCPAFPRKVRLP